MNRPYFEQHEDMRKQVRKWKRACQLRLIEERNPGWIPAYAGMTFWNKDFTRILHEYYGMFNPQEGRIPLPSRGEVR